eukprot:XP_001703981.1 Hypothetical protein GL50803_90628 [Giardia lamblia ATCC 50803]
MRLVSLKEQSYVCVLVPEGVHEGRVTVLVLHPLLVLKEELYHFKAPLLRGDHQSGPAGFVPEALFLLNKQLNRPTVPLLGRVHEGRHLLLVTLAGADSLFK